MIYEPSGGTGMVHISIIEARLSQLGFRASRWFRPEINELQHILVDNERIEECVQGRYFGGFALLVATDHRLLLIDKKIPYLSVEDIRYDMISAINYSSQWANATITISTFNKEHRFSSWKYRHSLRKLTNYAQKRVIELRQGPQEVMQPAPAAPTLAQAYNYGQLVQFQPPALPMEKRKRLPSPHMPRIMGATAVIGAKKHSNPWTSHNPYTNSSLMMTGQPIRES